VAQHIEFLLLGLASGGVYAALTLALVSTYRSSGVVNFATGGIALYAAYVYAYLRQGQLLLLIPPLPTKVSLGTQLGFVPAAVITLVMTAVLGLVIYLLVFRPLRAAPAVAKAVASIGVMLLVLSLTIERIGTAGVFATPILPSTIWKFGSVIVPSGRVWLAAIVVALALGLGALSRFTRFGLTTRAAAETEKGAYVSGISPDRLAMLNAMLSAAVAGVAGILIAPVVPIDPLTYTLFIVPALAAAICGRFESLLPAVIAGLLIGMLQSDATYLVGKYSWLPSSGLPELLPLALILLVLVVRGKPLPTRGAIVQRTLGIAPRPRTVFIPTTVGAACAVLGILTLSGDWRNGFVTSLIFSVIALSSVVVTGFAGQVSLAQLPLAGVGGFLLGGLTSGAGLPFPVAPLLAALGAMVIGVVVGLPALRIRGLPVAVVTLALGVALEAIWFKNTDLVPIGGKLVTPASLFGLDLNVGSGAAFPRVGFCLMVLVVLVAVAVGVARLRRSRLGSAMLAVRANEQSAAAAGVDVTRTKLAAFAIASFIAGIGGSLLAYQQGTVSFESFDAFVGLALFAVTYVAGITSVSGGILAGFLGAGGLLFVALNKSVNIGGWFGVITALALVVIVILSPEGITGPIHAWIAKWRQAQTSETVQGTRSAALAAHGNHRPGPAGASPQTLLSVRDMTVRYGGVVAVNNVSFDVPRGRIVGLIGPNGAGKTTLIDALTGFAQASGKLKLGDLGIESLPAHKRARAGLRRTFQSIELYDDLSLEENVSVGLEAGRSGYGQNAEPTIAWALDLLGIAELRHSRAGQLSHGQRQLVSVARALVGRPEMLLLDEPAGGLDSNESAWLGERLKAIRDTGITILIVDHDMHLVLNLCDEIRVLDFGEEIASGPPEVIRSDRAVAAAYLGDTHASVGAETL
jgi:ABC-type branched-subunit amino acid transport system ATPase component/branched-subunit amino acid ABC-type transport system permease component